MKKQYGSRCLVIRDGKILMTKNRENRSEWWCMPGGGMDPGEKPEECVLRELKEECCVDGTIVRKTSQYTDPIHKGEHYTYLVDIGNQEPSLGKDPERDDDNQRMIAVEWLALNEICERDRVFLWASGLLTIREFADEIMTWSDEISYPTIRQS